MSRNGDGTTVSAVVATLGMFIIDTLRYEDAAGADLGDKGFGERIGGGGTHFALGARMWLAPNRIRMIVDRGEDFPSSVQDDLDRYSANTAGAETEGPWQYRDRCGKTTKAVNIYRTREPRRFAYLTPKLRLDPRDLVDERHDRLPEYIHCICSPERVASICAEVDDDLRDRWPTSKSRPCIVWEPIPDSAVPENLAQITQAAASVDIISPNHEELASMLGIDVDEKEMDRAMIESMTQQLVKQIKHKHGAVTPPILCIRCAAMGALISMPKGDFELLWWIDSFFDATMQHRLVDVTGAGNSFLGGFTAGLQLTGKTVKGQWTLDEIRLAAFMGTVSASYTIEAVGVPRLTTSDPSERNERWNDSDSPHDRLVALQVRGQ